MLTATPTISHIANLSKYCVNLQENRTEKIPVYIWLVESIYFLSVRNETSQSWTMWPSGKRADRMLVFIPFYSVSVVSGNPPLDIFVMKSYRPKLSFYGKSIINIDSKAAHEYVLGNSCSSWTKWGILPGGTIFKNTKEFPVRKPHSAGKANFGFILKHLFQYNTLPSRTLIY